MRTLAILPIKAFAGAKQRLGGELDIGERRALAEAMFSDVLVALRRAKAVDETLVVTADDHAAQIAGGYGVNVLVDQGVGHNPAAVQGVQAALQSLAGRALLVPGDCPLLDPTDLDALIARPPGPGAALIVPDRHGTGTNALLLTPPDALAPSFGPGSCKRHLALARRAGTEAEIVEVSSLALDVDTPDDLALLRATLEATHGAAAHTRGALQQQLRSRS